MSLGKFWPLMVRYQIFASKLEFSNLKFRILVDFRLSRLTVEFWLSCFGYQVLAADNRLSGFCCGLLFVQLWMTNFDCRVSVAVFWLSFFSFRVSLANFWLSNFDC